MAKGKRRNSSAGEATRARIIQATLKTLAGDGIVGASARRIAEVGEFNQALIFYHFGSIDDLIVAAIESMSAARMQTHGPRLHAVSSLAELVEVGRDLLAQDRANGHTTILVQAMAGAGPSQGENDLGPRMFDALLPWIEATSAAIDRAADADPMLAAIPGRDLALAVTALFLGLEILAEIDPERGDASDLMQTLVQVGHLAGALGPASPLGAILNPDRTPSDG